MGEQLQNQNENTKGERAQTAEERLFQEYPQLAVMDKIIAQGTVLRIKRKTQPGEPEKWSYGTALRAVDTQRIEVVFTDEDNQQTSRKIVKFEELKAWNPEELKQPKQQKN